MNNENSKRSEELLEALVKIQLAPVIKKELSDKKMKQLYEITGKSGIIEISKKIGFATGKISKIWQRWEEQGLLKKYGKTYKKILS